jgi:hypothetical protein
MLICIYKLIYGRHKLFNNKFKDATIIVYLYFYAVKLSYSNNQSLMMIMYF